MLFTENQIYKTAIHREKKKTVFTYSSDFGDLFRKLVTKKPKSTKYP